MKYEIDPETNLPKLPKNHFWRVKRSYGSNRVEIRRNLLFGSYCVQWTSLFDTTLRSMGLLWAANIVWDQLYNPQPEPEKKKPTPTPKTTAPTHLYGDYPPKKLENKWD
jgi:hypothetical protein